MKKRLACLITSLIIVVSLVNLSPNASANANWFDAYKPVVNAYADLESSGWRNYNRNIIGDSYFAQFGGLDPSTNIQFVGYSLNDLALRYALYDINGDGMPELVIGAEYVQFNQTFITGVYYFSGNTVKVAMNLSLAPYETATIHSDGSIAVSSGRMGYYDGYFVRFSNGEAYTTGAWSISDGEPPEHDPGVSLDWSRLSNYTNEPPYPFSDVAASDWYYNEVVYVYEKNLMTGTSSTTFNPDAALSRAMVATVLYRAEGSPPVSYNRVFSDVPSGQWYSNAITWTSENGIVNGYGNGLFGTNDDITREQLATMILNYAKYKNYDTTTATALSQYTDAGKINSWALEGMQWCVAEGLISGMTTTTLSPQETTTRAQCATILMRFIERY